MTSRPYDDGALAAAIASSRSWRGVLRELGLTSTSAGSMRSARRHAERLGLSTQHFTGQRRWSDSALVEAVSVSRSWQDVARHLDVAASGTTLTALQAHSVRLGIGTEHLTRSRPVPLAPPSTEYDASRLREAGSLFAATWFTMRGSAISWPLEPARYDLLVDDGTGLQRVQVKTTVNEGADAVVGISNSRRPGRSRAIYAPGEIDSCFVIDGGLSAFLIPYDVVAGYSSIKLSHYVNFMVCERGDLLSACASPGP